MTNERLEEIRVLFFEIGENCDEICQCEHCIAGRELYDYATWLYDLHEKLENW